MAATVSFYASGANPDPEISDEYAPLNGEDSNPDNDCLKSLLNVVVAVKHCVDGILFQLQILLSPADSLPWIEAFKFAESVRRENEEALPTPMRKELATAFADIVRAELAATNRKARACTRCRGSSLFHLHCPACDPTADPLTEIPEVPNPVLLPLHSTPPIHPTNITIDALNQAAAKAANVTRAKQKALCTPRTTQSAAVQAAADEVNRCLGDGGFGTPETQHSGGDQRKGPFTLSGSQHGRTLTSQRVVIPLHPTMLSPIQSPITPVPATQFSSSSASTPVSSSSSDGAPDQLQGPETPTRATHLPPDEPGFSASITITPESLPKALSAIFKQSALAKQQQLGDILEITAGASPSDAHYITDQSPFEVRPQTSSRMQVATTSMSLASGSKSVTFELDSAGNPVASPLVSSHALNLEGDFEEPSRFATAMEHSVHTNTPNTATTSPATSPIVSVATSRSSSPQRNLLSSDNSFDSQHTPSQPEAAAAVAAAQPSYQPTAHPEHLQAKLSAHEALGPATPRPDDPLPATPSTASPATAPQPSKATAIGRVGGKLGEARIPPVIPPLNLPPPGMEDGIPFSRSLAAAPKVEQQQLEERRRSHAQAGSTVSPAVATAAMVAAHITPPAASGSGAAAVLTWTESGGAAVAGGSSPVNNTHQPKILRHASQPVLTEIEPENARKETSELQRAKSTSRHRSTPSYHSFGIQLGQGSFGTVQKGLWRGRMVAIKTIRVKGTDVRAQEHAMREAAITYALDHPNIIKTHSWDIQVAADPAEPSAPLTPGARTPRNPNTPHVTPRNVSSRTAPNSTPDWIVSMVVELCDADLVQALRASCFHGTDRRPILPYILKIGLDVAHGMEHLHSRRIIHGDMKSTNVLLKHQKNAISGFVAKVADLGMSYKLPRGSNEIVGVHSGTRGYIAPEVQREGVISLAADVYSYGVVLWELYHAKPAVASRTFPQFQRGCPKQLEALVRCCLSQNPALRPTFGGIMLQLCSLIDNVNGQRTRSSSRASSSSGR